MHKIYYSIIIPVYNRPDELHELLESLADQSFKDFEVIIVEDGSTLKSDHIVNSFKGRLDISYYYKENSGPGTSRNFGFNHAKGNYFIVLDSDCTVQRYYLENVHNFLSKNYLDAFGGPDKAHDSFTPLQKAINYSMTSFFTTAGIRGGKKHIGKFHPRSFNMGISKEVFEVTNGFSRMRYGEDVEFSIRIINLGYKTDLIDDAFVYHKRRSKLSDFFKQVFHSGAARIDIAKNHPKEIKVVHIAPSLFLLFCLAILFMPFLSIKTFYLSLCLLTTYAILIFVDATMKNQSFKVGFLSVAATFTQLIGYGMGFISALWNTVVLKHCKQ